MKLTKITDPAILAQLNAPSGANTSANPGPKITDPAVLAQLNAPAPQQQPAAAPQEQWHPKIWDMPYVGRPPTQQEQAQAGQDLRHAAVGGAQGLVNIVPDTLNMLNPTSHKIPRANFAPQDTASQVGQFAAPFAGPQAVETGVMKVLPYLPKAFNAVKDLMALKKGATVTNALKTAGKSGAKAGYVNALEHPENAWSEFGKGAALGTAGSLLFPAATSAMPALSMLGKAGLGAGTGYMSGQLLGVNPNAMAVAGAGTAMGLPIRRLMGIEPEANVMEEMLRGVNQGEVAPVVAANRRLGTNATPGQAANNYVTRAAEERVKNMSDDAAYRAVELEKQATQQQGNAFNRMLDKIYKPTKQNENAIARLYRQAKDPQYDLDPVVVNAMAQEPIIKEAMDFVSKMPDMENVAMNNYAYLQRVKIRLDNMQREMANSSDGGQRLLSGNIKNIRDQFVRFLGDNNPAYKQANALAYPRFVREELVDKVNRMPEETTGKRVYQSFFGNKAKEDEVMSAVKNFPEARKDLNDMKVGWKHLSEMKTPSQAGGQAAANIDNIRNTATMVKNWLSKIGSSKGSLARLEYIHSPDWEKGFAKLAEIKDRTQRRIAMGQFLSETAVKTGLPQKEISNLIDYLNSTESDENGK